MRPKAAVTVGGVAFLVAAAVSAVVTGVWTATEFGFDRAGSLVAGSSLVAALAGLLGGLVGGHLARRRLPRRSGVKVAAGGAAAHGVLQGLLAVGSGAAGLGAAVLSAGGVAALTGAVVAAAAPRVRHATDRPSPP
ncbi:hypothetical protein [Egicoccus sp. AB-alg2]|uniref:hypothetical protein n=1 Tax=Egicoccus sp. AB-alg2 TaxID=3242693 RepID=UPI00359D29FF